MMSVQLRCEELREAELKMEVFICGLEQGEFMGEEINEKDLMNYWNSSKELEDMLTREADEVMKFFIFKSHSLCMFAGCANYGGQSDETIIEMKETLVVKSDGECLSKEEGTDLLQQ